MKQSVRLTESNLHRIVKESVNKILNEKYPRKQGKIQINGEWIDAIEDGVDKYGNPMYKTKSDTIKSGRKCKDGSRRIQNFNFRPDITETDLHRIVKESVNRVLNEMSLHKGSSVYAHNNDQWAPEGDEWKWRYDGDRVDRYLWRMKKDAQKDGCSGPKGFPMASWFGKNCRSYFRFIDEYSGDTPHVPYIDRPEDDYEMSPEDLYRAIDELCYGDSCGYDNYRAFG